MRYANPTSLQELTYSYDLLGNMLSIVNARAGGTQTQSFSYDALQRLTSSAASGGTEGAYLLESYSYKTATGNLSGKGGVTYSYAAQASSCPQGALSKPHAVTGAGTSAFCYDQNGNMVHRTIGANVYNLTYDAENRLTAVSGAATATFVYDGNGKRVKATVGGATTTYIGDTFEWSGSTATMKKYYTAGGTRLAMRTGDTLSWLLGDHLGSTNITANSSAIQVAKLLYKPWGEERFSSGTTPTTFKFTGQRQEGSFGLYLFASRWFDPALGRWAQPDTDIPKSQGVQAFDRYAYVNNNPLHYSDPTGHSIWDTIGQFATGFVSEFARTTAWYSPKAQDILSVSATESDASLAGRVAADIATIAIGVVEVAGGIAIGTGGTAVACGTTLCIGGVATVGAGAVAVGAGATTALAGASGLGGNIALISGKPQGFADPNSLTDHFLKHRSEFGFLDESEYLAGARGFIATEGNRGVLSKVRANGDKIIFNPTTNEFAVVSKDGTIRTYFKPDPSIHGYKNNLEYFKAQK